MAAKRKFLSLEEKCNAIKLLDNGMPAYKVAEQLGVGKRRFKTYVNEKLRS
jgi:transposase